MSDLLNRTLNTGGYAYQDLIGETPAAFQLIPYAKAALPSASKWIYGMIYVTDETGGAVPAFSDGTNWRRVTDRAVVS